MVRATAEKNGYNVAVIEAMIDKDRGLSLTNVLDGQTNVVTIARVNEILTLTNTEARRSTASRRRSCSLPHGGHPGGAAAAVGV